MVMPKKPVQYTSIEEIRSSFYPTSAGMLNLDREEIIDFPSSLAGKSRQILRDIAKKAAEAHDAEPETGESQTDVTHTDLES